MGYLEVNFLGYRTRRRRMEGKFKRGKWRTPNTELYMPLCYFNVLIFHYKLTVTTLPFGIYLERTVNKVDL